MFPRMSTRTSPLARLTASLSVVLVLALSVFAASPELHGFLHDHGPATQAGSHAGATADSDHDDGCVVTLFAQGLLAVFGVLALRFAGRTLPLSAYTLAERVGPPAPAFLHLPPQAPPARS